MSLIKSFNFSFLKQNIKKSKGTIILSLIIVPLIFSMYFVVSGLELSSPEKMEFETLETMDFIFMYIIPFVYSVILFGFVFKKSSTDFMNSMPINRKTMFVTNTIGGIILITLIQLLSGFFALLWGAIFKNIIVFPTAILDIMINSWISYVFVFIASNLAMSFSGTKQTQFVSTILILFLIPVCVELTSSIINAKSYDYSYYTTEPVRANYDLSIASGYQTYYFDTLDSIKNWTMPYKLFRHGLAMSTESNIRMLVLSVVYYIIGLKLYKKRKMEFSEESFENQKLHLFIKALTLVPILLFVNRIGLYDDSITLLVISIIFCAIYYFIFDIVTKRKVPIKTTIFSFVMSVFVIQSMIMFVGKIDNKNLDIDVDDIKEISIGRNSNGSSYYYSYIDYVDNCFDGNYFMKNKQILNLILDGRDKVINPEDKNYNNSILYDDVFYSNFANNKELYFNIKLKNGKEYYIRTTIALQNYKEIVKILSQNENYIKHFKNEICKSNGIIEIGNDIVDNKTKRKIEKVLDYNIKDMVNFSLTNDSINYITKTIYKDHRIFEYKIPINSNKELASIVAEFANKKTLENIKGYQYGINVQVYSKNNLVKSYYNDEKILDFMQEHASDEFDPSKSYYILNGGVQTIKGYKKFTFYTNNTKAIDKMINQYDEIY